MEYNFEQFTKKNVRNTSIHIYVDFKYCNIRFSNAFMRKINMPEYITLYYDGKNRSIGFYFCKKTEGSYKITHYNNTYHSINPRAFFRKNNIQISGAFEPQKIEWEGKELYIINLT